MSKIVNISPCEDWYYVGIGAKQEAIVFKVAAWALNIEGQVHGLIAAGNKSGNEPARLTLPPPIGGTYKIREHLSQEELEAAAKP